MKKNNAKNNMAKNNNAQLMKITAPDPALNIFEKLIGKWELKGRTLDSKKKTFPASVYASMSGDVLSSEWYIRGNTITGGWRPNEGTPTTDGTGYDAVMVRVRQDLNQKEFS